METGVPHGLACEDLRLELLLVEALQREAERLAAFPAPEG
ncbi:hypothetical protein PS9374_00013 [Planomonospora sphaerica]|uniref:Uncharacterized protein n=3 Tax=Planomonospora TaxID=1998 RepID=A0A161M6M5_9ACTN|nr:hypothetical protein PS9374_00013 [Planomonospora sphaerica]GGK83530.1 hypothetical protein GCM10010126_48550 [Planomonospora parontospora]GII10472.1 hypothetical protein Ppa06_42700 [Planomonospora parontospora subsp. parontospora]